MNTCTPQTQTHTHKCFKLCSFKTPVAGRPVAVLESSPEATGEEARVGGVAAGQLQGEGGVVHVAVRQQHQAPGASGGWQQTEAAQGPPQLSAAPHW